MYNELMSKLKIFTVLYVEDEDGIRKNIQAILEHFFKKVFIAKDAKNAYKVYIDKKPDLIITDIKMDDETGIDLIKKIRLTDKNIKVIITSAFTDVDYLLDATELNLVKYIVKPITQEKLNQALNSFIELQSSSITYTLTEDWFFDCDKQIVSNSTDIFHLTIKENNFLSLLMKADNFISYKEIENNIWDANSTMTPNAMRLFIKNIRKKLPKHFLKNVQGKGYMIKKKETI